MLRKNAEAITKVVLRAYPSSATNLDELCLLCSCACYVAQFSNFSECIFRRAQQQTELNTYSVFIYTAKIGRVRQSSRILGKCYHFYGMRRWTEKEVSNVESYTNDICTIELWLE